MTSTCQMVSPIWFWLDCLSNVIESFRAWPAHVNHICVGMSSRIVLRPINFIAATTWCSVPGVPFESSISMVLMKSMCLLLSSFDVALCVQIIHDLSAEWYVLHTTYHVMHVRSKGMCACRGRSWCAISYDHNMSCHSMQHDNIASNRLGYIGLAIRRAIEKSSC